MFILQGLGHLLIHTCCVNMKEEEEEEEEEEEKFEIRRGNNLKFIAPHFHRSVLNVEGRTGRFKKNA